MDWIREAERLWLLLCYCCSFSLLFTREDKEFKSDMSATEVYNFRIAAADEEEDDAAAIL